MILLRSLKSTTFIIIRIKKTFAWSIDDAENNLIDFLVHSELVQEDSVVVARSATDLTSDTLLFAFKDNQPLKWDTKVLF